MTLYEIDSQIMALVDPETGEISDFSALDELQMAREQKIENIALAYKNCVAEAAMIKAEVDNLTARKKAADSKAESLKKYLSYALNGEAFKTARCEVSYRKSSRLEVADEAKVIRWLRSHGHKGLIKRQESVSKTDVGNLLKNGAVIPGVSISDHLNMGVK